MYNQNQRLPKDNEPSLLVIGNHVYIEGTDGLHHACVIRDKQNNKYIIQFPDGSTKRVFEHDLIWLGFHGLPRSHWPNQPIVLVSGKPVRVDNGNELLSFGQGENNDSNLGPRMLKVMRSRKDLMRWTKLRSESSPSESQEYVEGCFDGQRNTLSAPGSRIQPRSSVLRLHLNLLETEEASRCEMANVCKTSNSGNGLSSKRQCVPKSRTSMKTRSKAYETDDINDADSRNDNRKRQLNNVEVTSSESHITPLLDKDALRLSDGTDLASETFCDTTDLTSPNLLAAWQPGDWNQWNEPLNFDQSHLSPPVTPRPQYITLPLEIPPFETFFDSLPSESTFPIENTQLFEDLVSGKRAKRELPRKCRKVYGIDNKKSWCTQCRWKKACTRFKG